MNASHRTLAKDLIGSMKTMRSLSVLACLILLLGSSASVRAGSPWRSLARIVSPKPMTQPIDNNDPASYQNGLEQMKNDPVNGQSAAADLQEQPGSLQNSISGLAVAGKSKSMIDLGQESDDQGDFLATDLFRRPEIRQLLGDEPRFIYDSAQRPDPMVVPWVRRAAIYKELSARAKDAIDAEDFQSAAELYVRIINMNDERYNDVARACLAEIQAREQDVQMAAVEALQAPEKEPVIELPAWVADNTTGVIIEPGSGVCLIGDFMLAEGQTLPNYPDVKIATIEQKRVVYQIKDQSFEVKLDKE